MTTILIFILLVKTAGVSPWFAPVVLLAALYEFMRISILLDIQRKTTEIAEDASSAFKAAEESRAFAFGALLEARRIGEVVAPLPVVEPEAEPEPAPKPELADPDAPINL